MRAYLREQAEIERCRAEESELYWRASDQGPTVARSWLHAQFDRLNAVRKVRLDRLARLHLAGKIGLTEYRDRYAQAEDRCRSLINIFDKQWWAGDGVIAHENEIIRRMAALSGGAK